MRKLKACGWKAFATGLALGAIELWGTSWPQTAAGQPASPDAQAKVPSMVPEAILVSAKPSYAETLAAREVRRYLYVRTGRLVPIFTKTAQGKPAIVVGTKPGTKQQPVVEAAGAGTAWQLTLAGLHGEQYLLARRAPVRPDEQPLLVVAGADLVGTLYAAYRLAERLGERFSLEGDVVPDAPVTRKINRGGPAYRDYQADWPSSRYGGRTQHRYLPNGDFYADWCQAQFGAEVAQAAAAIFGRIDCHLPRPSDWVGGPGGIKPDARPRSEVSKQYAFVEELAALRPRVHGAGNIERFEYWLNTFQYMRAMARANGTWAQFNAALAKARVEKDPAARKKMAQESVLPLRRQLVADVAEVQRHLLATISTTGDMGTVANGQQHNLPEILDKPGRELAKQLEQPLPPDAPPTRQYVGPPRRVVPVVRTGLSAGERLMLSAAVLGAEVRQLAVKWRPMGSGEFRPTNFAHMARGGMRLRCRPRPPRTTWSIMSKPRRTAACSAFPPRPRG